MQRTSSCTSVHTHKPSARQGGNVGRFPWESCRAHRSGFWGQGPGHTAAPAARRTNTMAMNIPAGHRERSPTNHPGGDRRDPGPLPSRHSSQFAQFSFATTALLPLVSGRVPTATLLGQTPAGCRRGLIPHGLFRAPRFPPNAGLTMRCHLGAGEGWKRSARQPPEHKGQARAQPT